MAHCVASSTTQVNAPMGEPGRQHCTGGAVVVVVLVVVVVVLVVVEVVDVVVLVVVDVEVEMVEVVVVVGDGSGEHEPAPRSRPPSVAHCVALSTTQVNAPMGEPGRQHCTGGGVVVDVVDVEVDVLVLHVYVEVVLVDVVVVGSTHVPSEGGRFHLEQTGVLVGEGPGRERDAVRIAPADLEQDAAAGPEVGAEPTDIGEDRALPLTLMMKTPLPLFLICADLTGPCSPRASLYLKPFAVLPDQKGLPLLAVPCGSAKACCVGWSPSARSVSVAPPTAGSPTKGFGLRPLLRLAGEAAPVGRTRVFEAELAAKDRLIGGERCRRYERQYERGDYPAHDVPRSCLVVGKQGG